MHRRHLMATSMSFLLLATATLYGDEIPEGTILDQNNLQTLSQQTVDGKKIADLLLPSQK